MYSIDKNILKLVKTQMIVIKDALPLDGSRNLQFAYYILFAF